MQALKNGDRLEGVQSLQEAAQSSRQEPIPDIGAAHARLLGSAEAVDYLVAERGFTLEVVQRMQVGLDDREGKRWLLFPYLHQGQAVFAKWRTLPPAGKDFRATRGRENRGWGAHVCTLCRRVPEDIISDAPCCALTPC